MIKQIPNILTGGRLVLSVVFLVMIFLEPGMAANHDTSFYLDVAFVIFLLAGLTDIIDGPIARKMNVTSKFGRMVDPLADKVLICGAFIVFALIGEPKLFNLSKGWLAVIQWSFAAIIIAREAFVTTLRHWSESRGIKFPATLSGKLKMFVQAFAVGTVIVKMAYVQTAYWGYWFMTITYLVTLFITVISGFMSLKKVKIRPDSPLL
jgi:CDP-diacylglycerol---glycerol-3-phosphate 3-phosphatidyltransferase